MIGEAMNPAAKARVASGMLLGLMALAWFTIDPGRVRLIALLLLGMFLFRVVLHAARSRYSREEHGEDEEV